MDFEMVIKNGEICTPSGRFRFDIGINKGKIDALTTPGILKGVKELDVTGKTILPGLVHTHCHLRDPGFTHKENFETGTMAAAAGGVTCTIDMPNVKPPTTTVERYQEKLEIFSKSAYVDFQSWPGPVKPEEVLRFGKVDGIPGIKEFMIRDPKAKYPHMPELSIANHGDLFLLMKATKEIGKRMLVHGEDPDLMYALSLPFQNDNTLRGRMALRGYNNWWFVTRDIGTTVAMMMAHLEKMKIHVLHMGQGRYMHRIVKRAKEDGQDVTAELEAITMIGKQTDPKINKWLQLGYGRSESEYVDELWEAANDGTADVLLMEHAPHHRDEILAVETDTWNAPGGLPSLQEMLPMLLTQVNRGKISLERFVLLTAENPARLAGLYPRKGAIQVGADADFAVVDMNAEKTILEKDMFSNAGFTAFEGYTAKGIPVCTIVRGNIVMQDGKIVGKKGYGQYISAGPYSI